MESGQVEMRIILDVYLDYYISDVRIKKFEIVTNG